MFGPSALVWDGVTILPAALDPKLKKGTRRGQSVLAVGDEVETERGQDGALSITAVAERRTYLARFGGEGQEAQVIAANVERAVIISSADEPPFRPAVVDRWALLARRGGLIPFLVLNKIDLVPLEAAEQMIEEAAGRLAAGVDPGVVPERFLIGAARFAFDRKLARPGTIAENFYKELARR